MKNEHFVNLHEGLFIGDLHLNCELSDIQAIYGKSRLVDAYPEDDLFFHTYKNKGLSFALDSKGILRYVHCYSGRPGGYTERGYTRFNVLTDKGIHMNSRKEEVLLKYGHPSSSGEQSMAPIPSEWFEFKDICFDFRKKDAKLISICLWNPFYKQVNSDE